MISTIRLRAGTLKSESAASACFQAYWARVTLSVILALAAVLDFAGLSREGYNNEYYAAAVKSMSLSWHNFFFSSFDPAGFVTIDKPPLGFWFQVASVKIFGFSGAALLIPQALAGVLCVALLYHLVSRTFGQTAGLISALALATTPISVATNRNNTIDSLLVLAVLAGTWAVLRAADSGKFRWLLLCALFVGLGFNIKMLQAYLVVPAFGLAYLLGSRATVRRRLIHLAAAGMVLLAVSLSWVTAVDMTSAGSRPWVDSTSTNSALDLAIGYNGLQRLTGNHSNAAPIAPINRNALPGKVTGVHRPSNARSTPGADRFQFAGGPGGIGENGPTGPLRLLDTQLGSQIGWLLPLALLGLAVGLWQARRNFRAVDERQRSLVLWGAWLLTTVAFFSVALFFHAYYLVMTAPAVSALAGIAVVSLWQEYQRPGSKTWWLLPLCLLVAAGVQVRILSAYPSWARWLVPVVVGGCVLAALGLSVRRLRSNLEPGVAMPAAALGILVLLAPPAAFASYTMLHTQTGGIVRAGPVPAGLHRLARLFALGLPTGAGVPPGDVGPPPSGGLDGPMSMRPGRSQDAFLPPHGSTTSLRQPGPAGFGGPLGVPGSDGREASTALIKYLLKHRGTAKYLVATSFSNQAAPIIIATGEPVMSLGGFSGSDPILTISQLKLMLTKGMVRYFLLEGGGPGGRASQNLSIWIRQHSKRLSVGGTPLYEYADNRR